MSLEADLHDEMIVRGSLYCTFIGGQANGWIIEVANNLDSFHVPKDEAPRYHPGIVPIEFRKIETVVYYRTENPLYFEAR